MEESKGGEGERRGGEEISGGRQQREKGKRRADDAGLASRAELEDERGERQRTPATYKPQTQPRSPTTTAVRYSRDVLFIPFRASL